MDIRIIYSFFPTFKTTTHQFVVITEQKISLADGLYKIKCLSNIFSFYEKVKKGNNSYKWSEQIVESISKSFYDNCRPYEISGGIFNWNVDDVGRASFFMNFEILPILTDYAN